jgi:prephenate dehydrogenase/chorismate mutase
MRATIDSLDETIAALICQRLSLSRKIGELKSASGLAVKDVQREQAVIANVKNAAGSPAIAEALGNIYQSIIKESCALQEEGPIPSSTSQAHSKHKHLYFPEVLIVGLGLIGGAMARQIKRILPDTKITAIDVESVIGQALAEGIVDATSQDLQSAVAKASLILLCATPAENLRLLEQIAPMTKRRQIVMDVTSTKQAICGRAEDLRIKADFVGGHPLFGNHKSGLAASGELGVDGQRFCLVPTRKSSELTMLRLSRWLSDLRLQVIQVTAEEHDKSLAATSHVVQLTAVAIGSALATGRTDEQLRQLLQLSGSGLASFSRLMSSPANLWIDIVAHNKQHTLDVIGQLVDELENISRSIRTNDTADLHDKFAAAQRVHAALK